MRIKLTVVLCFVFSFLLFACGLPAGDVSTGQSIEQLKSEVLSSACDEETKRGYEEEIERQSEDLSDSQLRRLLIEMKNNIRCN